LLRSAIISVFLFKDWAIAPRTRNLEITVFRK
jgi:hypothetical protein